MGRHAEAVEAHGEAMARDGQKTFRRTLIRKHRVVAHTLERAFEREDLAIRDAEPLLHRALADIRDPRRAASPSEMQRSRTPLSSPMSECIY